jgi:glutathione S-transferase
VRLYDYSASGNCYKARLLLALLDRPYERVPIDIFAGETLTPEFGALNPARETPVLELEDGEVIVQSNAILWYLGEGTDYLPDDALGRACVVQWLTFEQEWIMGGAGSARFLVITGRFPEIAQDRLARGRRGLKLLARHLEDRAFVVGDAPTIADLSLFAYTHVAPDAGLELSEWPAIERWIERIEGLPGYMNDFEPYPENARPGASRSIYDVR